MTPTEAELFSRYNPDLQRRSLENRVGKQEDFNKFVAQLKEYSKSDKPSTSLGLTQEGVHISQDLTGLTHLPTVWEVAAEEDARRKREGVESAEQQKRREFREAEARREELRRHSKAG